MNHGDVGQKVAPGSEAVYSPADSHGHFAALVDDELHPTGLAHAFDLDELELDPNERRPGGPVAEAVAAYEPADYVKKWAVPFVGFLSACLLQSIALYSATCRYVRWMDSMVEELQGSPSLDSRGIVRDAAGPKEVAGLFKLQDPFADNFARPEGASDSPLLALLTMLMPLVLVIITARSNDLRLWTRTLLVGIVLALLNAFVSWMTVVPSATGWATCSVQLDAGLLQVARAAPGASILGVIGSILHVLWLWIFGICTGLRYPPNLVCGGAFLSSPTYFYSLCALALYDGARTATRKMKPHFRWLYRVIFAFVLTFLAVTAAHWELLTRQQYSADVALSVILTLLLYGSPPVAICVDRWLTWGSPSFELLAAGNAHPKGQDPHDDGDVVVPICCFPFCCLHGRFFLYSVSVEETEAALQSQDEREQRNNAELQQRAAKKAEEFRIAQEQTTQRLIELDALIRFERERSEMRDREEREQLQESNERSLTELRADFDLRVARGLGELEAQVQVKRQAAMQLEDHAQREARGAAEAEAEFDEQLKALAAKCEAIKARKAAKVLELQQLQEQAELELQEGETLAEELGGE